MSGLLAASRDAVLDRNPTARPKCPCCGTWLEPNRVIVDLATNKIIGPRGTIRIQPQSAELVYKLNERRNRIASDEAIYVALWGSAADSERAERHYLKLVSTAVSFTRFGRTTSSRTCYPGIRTIGLDIVRIRDVGYQLVIMG